MLYRYIQTEEKGKWKPVPITQDFDDEIRKMGAVRMSVLALSEPIDEDTTSQEVGYIGPLYFDIDCANLNTAISSTQELVAKLLELEVPQEGVQVYCSGSKGFHVFVPESLFLNSKRPIKGLPQIYMEVARDLYVMGVDFAVYSGGKGRMFRPENGLRPDGKYRVRVTLDELWQMTPELYQWVVSQPRQLEFKGPNGHKAPHLQAVFERARRRASASVNMRGTALPLEKLEPYAEEPPGCVDKLVQHEVKKGSKFNQVGLQLAAFVARAGVPDYKADSLAGLLAEHGESGTYNTPLKRKVHLMGLIAYARAKPNVAFTCAAMRSVVINAPCSTCPLNNKDLMDSTEVSEDGAVLGVLATPEGYYAKREKGESRLTTFTLHPLEVFMDQPQGGGTARRVGTTMEVHAKGEQLGTVYFSEEGWRSKSEFLKQLEGIHGISFLGGDTDIQRLKYAIYRHLEDDDVDEVTNVYVAGIHETKIGKRKIYTYVEPGLSINTHGVQGTHRLQGKVPTPPEIRKTRKPEMGDKAIRAALLNLLKVNAPEIVGQLVGWHSASHLKVQITSAYRQFPVLNLWGEAGSGKSMTSALFSYLNGVDFLRGGSPITLSTSTPYPIISVCSSTSTIPRLLEEFNRSQMKRFGMYELVTEILKSAWNSYPVPRGTLGKSKANGEGRTGAHVEELTIAAPLVVCSEQAPDKPALTQRMIQCQLTRSSREGRTEYFNKAIVSSEEIMSFARAMTMMALKTKEEWIYDSFDRNYESVPDCLIDRPRFSYTVVLAGLDFFSGVASSLNLNLEEEVEKLKKAVISNLSGTAETLSKSKTWSEVDHFLSGVAEMAQLALQNSPLSPLIPGRNFLALTERDELVLDLRIVYPMYQRHSRSGGGSAVFNSVAQLEPLLKSEPYFVTNERVMPEVAGQRKMWVLSLSKMQEKGHDINMFVR